MSNTTAAHERARAALDRMIELAGQAQREIIAGKPAEAEERRREALLYAEAYLDQKIEAATLARRAIEG